MKSSIKVSAPVSMEFNGNALLLHTNEKNVVIKSPTTVYVTNSNTGVEFLEQREANERLVLSELGKVHKSQWNACLSGPNKSQFMANLASVEKIGKGSYGEVYLTSVGTSPPFVIKEAYLNTIEQAQMMKHAGKRKSDRIPVSSYPEEAIMLSLVKSLIQLKKCPNYLYAYDLAFCESCKLSGGSRGFCYLTITEPGDGDLTRYFDTLMTNEIGWSVLYQLLMAVQAMHSTYAIHHRDIKANNVLFKTVPAGGWYSYTVKNRYGTNTYYVENAGILILLSDFGVSQSLNPTKGRPGECCGHRNARRVVSSRGIQKLEPINTKYQLVGGRVVPSKPTITWQTGKQSTNNLICPTILSKLQPDTPIILTDTVQFPPIEFSDDILDVLHMFSGKRRMCLPYGTHQPIEGCEDVKNAIAKIDQNDFYYDTYESIYYLCASEMLKLFYRNTMPPNATILGEYMCE